MKRTATKPHKNVVGATVRRLRQSQKVQVSQHDLAGRLAAKGIQLDQSAIARIERGERYVLDYEAAAIARVFRVSMDELFGRKVVR